MLGVEGCLEESMLLDFFESIENLLKEVDISVNEWRVYGGDRRVVYRLRFSSCLMEIGLLVCCIMSIRVLYNKCSFNLKRKLFLILETPIEIRGWRVNLRVGKLGS